MSSLNSHSSTVNSGPPMSLTRWDVGRVDHGRAQPADRRRWPPRRSRRPPGWPRTRPRARRRSGRRAGRRGRGSGGSRGGCGPWRRAVAGSRGSTPVMAPSTVAASATVRAMGPVTSWLWAMGTTPDAAGQPEGGLDPDQAVVRGGADDRPVGLGPERRPRPGWRRRPRPSPELEPHGLRSSTYGLRHCPARPAPAAGGLGGAEVGPLGQVGLAEDDRAGPAQPRGPRTRPRGTAAPSRASDPAVVSIRSPVSKLSLTRIGMPCRGPRTLPWRRSASSSPAMSRASGLTSITELSWIPRQVDLADAAQVGLGEPARGEPARLPSPPAARRWSPPRTGTSGTSWSVAAMAPAALATVPAPARAPAAPAVPEALRKLLRLIRSGMDSWVGVELADGVDDQGAAAAAADRLGGGLRTAAARKAIPAAAPISEGSGAVGRGQAELLAVGPGARPPPGWPGTPARRAGVAVALGRPAARRSPRAGSGRGRGARSGSGARW